MPGPPGPLWYFSGDSWADAAWRQVAVAEGVGDVSVLMNNGDGTYAPSVAYDTGDGETYSVAIGDLDGINGPDLAIGRSQPVTGQPCIM